MQHFAPLDENYFYFYLTFKLNLDFYRTILNSTLLPPTSVLAHNILQYAKY